MIKTPLLLAPLEGSDREARDEDDFLNEPHKTFDLLPGE